MFASICFVFTVTYVCNHSSSTHLPNIATHFCWRGVQRCQACLLSAFLSGHCGEPPRGSLPWRLKTRVSCPRNQRFRKMGVSKTRPTCFLFIFLQSFYDILCHWFPNMFDFHPTLFVGRQRVSIDLYLIDSVEATV